MPYRSVYLTTLIALSFISAQLTFTEHVVSNSADGATFIYALDMDGDVDMDVLSASREYDKIVWYENDGNNNDCVITELSKIKTISIIIVFIFFLNHFNIKYNHFFLYFI